MTKRARTSDAWSEQLDQITWDYTDGYCSPECAVERLVRHCGFSLPEAAAHLDGFSPPAEEAA